jgi:CBS domain containing-hemolysin-like protein
MSDLTRNLLGLAAVFALVLLNGFFVAAEFALVSVRKSRIDQLANEGSRAARGVQKALTHLDTYIAATQLGITMASLALGFIGEPALAGLLEPLFSRLLPQKMAFFTAHGIAVAIAFAIATALHIVLGELAPKSVALQRPDATSLVVTAPLNIFLTLFKPFIFALNGIGNGVVRLMGLSAVSEHGSVHSVEELEILVHTTREAGLLEEQQERMVAGVFEFEDIPVRKLMTPRLDITAVEADASIEELIRVVTESGHSRLPVYDDNLDNIVGIIHVKDVLKGITGERPPDSIRVLMRAPFFIPENKRAGFLLAELRRERMQIAVVRDEFGTVIGVVTIEDLLEEIVGEIHDEYDASEQEMYVEQLDQYTSLVDGRMPIEDFNERMGTDLPLEEADTLGGFVFGLVGHQPAVGEMGEWNGMEFRVEETDGRRIQRLRVRRPEAPPEEGSDSDDGPDEAGH